MTLPRFTLRRMFVVVALAGIGLAVLIKGAQLETQNPRSNAEDEFAWCVLAIGATLLGSAIGAACGSIRMAIVIGAIAPLVGFGLLVFMVWGYIILRSFFPF